MPEKQTVAGLTVCGDKCNICIRQLRDRITMLEFELRNREVELNDARVTVNRLSRGEY